MRVHQLEKAFLIAGAIMLVVFGLTLVASSVLMGIHLPGRERLIDPAQVRGIAPFDEPGVTQTGDNQYQVSMIAQAWAFQPAEVRVPAGAEVTFMVTSVDVIHGLHVERTRINIMLIPGQVGRVTYTFDEPGEYLMVCHEFCGAGHHIMAGKVIVE